MYMLRHMEIFYLASIYIFICMHMLKCYESFKMCEECMCFNDKGKDINVFIHVYEICMHMLKYYESFKMCKECICVLMIK